MAEIELRFAQQADVPVIMDIMTRAHENMKDGKMYITDTAEYVSERIRGNGFVLLALADGKPAGFFMVRIPGLGKDNLGYYLNFTEEQLMQVAIMDSVAVLPEYQGMGIMEKLLREAIALSEQDYSILLGTIAPENWPSRKNAEKQGLKPLLQIEKEGGYVRLIMAKFKETP